ncbi:MAG: glycoside hydrolase family 130 protein [Planctomycetes bacterium]|nr:glycoside hydrolase family 130 protein [Planctomycetota bacterium]
MDLTVTRSSLTLTADTKRVITRRYVAGDETRVDAIVARAMQLDEDTVSSLLADVLSRYASRHRNIEAAFDRNYRAVAAPRGGCDDASLQRQRLIGAYFTCEYSLESVALFNPSMVLHPDQSGLEAGSARFVMSLRACGEGHISSIEFRSGVIDVSSNISLDPTTPYAASEEPVDDHLRDKNRLFLKLQDMGAYSPMVSPIFQLLDDEYTLSDLQTAIATARRSCSDSKTFGELCETMVWLARSSYRLEFPQDSDISERVIFPVTENESRGIEDARFVRFTGDDGTIVYYATYTAYNGWQILPQIIQTTDFSHFRINTINGRCAQNKGMALFPRKVADRYVMISRLDGENIYILRSDDLHFWNEGEKIHSPTYPWEFIQIGNCGSPLETQKGWILITHGVGPMREYWISALLLDLDDPSRVIGHIDKPILMPTEEERDGYVPNVVYSCGGMIHNGNLVLPYAYSDSATRFATLSVDDLLARFVRR